MQNTNKMQRYKHETKMKIPQDIQICSQLSKIFNVRISVGRLRSTYIFPGFKEFSTDFSDKTWKILKTVSWTVEIGVDTTDILAF